MRLPEKNIMMSDIVWQPMRVYILYPVHGDDDELLMR